MSEKTESRTPSSAARLAESAAWVALGAMGLLLLTQVTGWGGSWGPVYALQALTPALLAPALPIAVAAALTRRWWIAGTAAVVVAALVWLAAPLLFPGGDPDVPDAAPRLTVLQANVLRVNPRMQDAAEAVMAEAARADVDVLALNELTPAMASALDDAGAAQDYPYRAERVRPGGDGTALWSRMPISRGEMFRTGPRWGAVIELDVTSAAGGTEPIRVVTAHPTHPLQEDGGAWRRALDAAADTALADGPPALLVGDLNASWWHPAFRDLLDRGFTDAHQRLGQGWSRSWPADSWLPAFVRLDHALTTDGVTAVQVRDFDIPGSDHTGLVVTVAVTGS